MDRFSFLTALDAKVCFDYPSLSAFKCGGNIGAVIFPEDKWELLQAARLYIINTGRKHNGRLLKAFTDFTE